MLNKLLIRQINKTVGDKDNIFLCYNSFLEVISETYNHFEKDRKMLERSIDISSNELIDLNKQLRNEAKELELIERKLRNILENTDIAYLLLDRETNVLLSNEVANRLSPYVINEKDPIGKNFLNLLTEERRNILEPRIKKVLEQGIKLQHEAKLKVNDFDRWFLISLNPIFNNDKEVIGISYAEEDITIKKETEEIIYKNELRFRSLIENSRDMVFLIDEKGKLNYVSPQGEKVLGFNYYENFGNNFFENVHPDDFQIAKKSLILVLKNLQKPIEIKLRYLNGVKEFIWIEGTITNMFNVPGVEAIVINIRDITNSELASKQLLESENKYKELFNINPMPMWVIDIHKFGFIDVNDAAIKHYGFTREEFLSMNALDMRTEQEREKYKQLVFNKDASKKDWGTWKHYKKDGTPIIVELNISTIEFNGNESRLVIANDVTEKIKTTKNLLKVEANLRTIIDGTNTGYILLDTDFKIRSFNKVSTLFFQNNSNYKELVEGVSYLDLLPNERKSITNNFLIEATSKLKSVQYEFHYINQLDENNWFEIKMEPVLNNDSKLIGVIVAIEEVTERKISELQIKSNNERFVLVSKATNNAIWDWNLTKSTIYLGDGYQTLFGYNVNEESTDPKDWLCKVHADDSLELIEIIQNGLLINSKKHWQKEYRYLKADNTYAYVLNKGFVIFDDNNKPIRMVGAMQDITYQKLNEIEKEKMNRDLLLRNKELKQFTFMVSHNLRSPVTNIMGLTYLLNDKSITNSTERDEFISMLAISANNLDHVIRDLNEVISVRNKASENRETVNLENLVSEIKNSISHIILKNNVEFVTNFSDISEITTVKSYLYSILSNLISNSIKYKQDALDLSIKIETKKVDDNVILHFEDNGIGIDLETNRKDLFKMYKRFHSHVDGMGIGLYMVKTQIEALGGSINIESNLNQGTKFILELPINQN